MVSANLVFAALVALSHLKNETQMDHPQFDEPIWSAYKAQYGKSYGPEEDNLRKQIFFSEKLKIDKYNEAKLSPSLVVNGMADLTWEDLGLFPLNLRKSPEKTGGPFLDSIMKLDTLVPQGLDWRNTNRVTGVKDQGLTCGSCWAFAAVGALEGQEVVRGKSRLVRLSEQNLIDCSSNTSCLGGWAHEAYEHTAKHGIMREKDYPFREVQYPCKADPSKVFFKNEGAEHLSLTDEEQLRQVVAKYGPVVAYLLANTPGFKYLRGKEVFSECPQTDELDHAVLIVGYGTGTRSDPELDYWIIKNSWGKHWADVGFGKVARNQGCLILQKPVIPTFSLEQSSGNASLSIGSSGQGTRSQMEERNSKLIS